MSLRGNRIVGIPVVLMHEGEGLVVTVETKSGYLFRGTVETAEDNMNMSMKEVDVTGPRGTKSTLRKLFLRGSQVVMVIYPPLLSHAPVFKRAALAAQGVMVAGGLGRGRQAAIMSKSEFVCAVHLRVPWLAGRLACTPCFLPADATVGPPGGARGPPPPMGGPPPRGPPMHAFAGPPMHPHARPPPMMMMGGGGMPPPPGFPGGPPMYPRGMPPPPGFPGGGGAPPGYPGGPPPGFPGGPGGGGQGGWPMQGGGGGMPPPPGQPQQQWRS